MLNTVSLSIAMSRVVYIKQIQLFTERINTALCVGVGGGSE